MQLNDLTSIQMLFIRRMMVTTRRCGMGMGSLLMLSYVFRENILAYVMLMML